MNLKEKLQELASERQNLIVALHQTNGAMKLLEQQILETQETPEEVQPSDTEASTPVEEAAQST